MPKLQEILKSRFGFDQFRPHQEAVCRAVVEGRDVLLVMPTGAGKSLCYQLPGLARGGTTLVISPLVALIEDQVKKLQGLGVRAERIHSGRLRDDSRQVARDYVAGSLDFLFIAPERLSVPGFPELLRRNPPTLLAVDEAHCISHWGHDFRPDYRLVGERLGEHHEMPIIALTATATPQVQEDIAKQLRLKSPARFIQGFRRENLAIEVAELNPSARVPAIQEILSQPGRLPAILYAPTRKRAEELASALGVGHRSAFYHAGMQPGARDAVQDSFLRGDLDLIVATIAFGMGIDKPNVRTVIHAALPASLEGYYQEIGRAGRDGLPSRAVLLQAFVDQKTHEFFFDQDYPDVTLLRKIRREIGEGGAPFEAIQARLSSFDPADLSRAIDKLKIHGGIEMDEQGWFQKGREDWDREYLAQAEHKRSQLKSMSRFCEAGGCRMLHLVRHFGDQVDDGKPCGTCDRCKPGDALLAAAERGMDPIEHAVATTILASLSGRDGQAAGRLFDEAPHGTPRADFERVLRALQGAGWVDSLEEKFEKDGREISYRKIHLTRKGKAGGAKELDEILISEGPKAAASRASSGLRRSKPKPARSAFRRMSEDSAAPLEGGLADERASELPKLFEALRAWRKEEAKAKGLPAFRILSDRVLYAICEAEPGDEEELESVRGMGPKLVELYGQQILRKVREG